eukprot:TRINITY_DN4968_c0_g1_i3.p1 TRINITY_DN4968_c0_g1~~TRINITY_DN4968_c0_g1_i3.p1  ORF type:complete len:886 (+),score=183.12 TRINITY_DN4968_c0_g1_i3:240-2660(+)
MGMGLPERRAECMRTLLAARADMKVADHKGKLPVNLCNNDIVRRALAVQPRVVDPPTHVKHAHQVVPPPGRHAASKLGQQVAPLGQTLLQPLQNPLVGLDASLPQQIQQTILLDAPIQAQLQDVAHPLIPASHQQTQVLPQVQPLTSNLQPPLQIQLPGQPLAQPQSLQPMQQQFLDPLQQGSFQQSALQPLQTHPLQQTDAFGHPKQHTAAKPPEEPSEEIRQKAREWQERERKAKELKRMKAQQDDASSEHRARSAIEQHCNMDAQISGTKTEISQVVSVAMKTAGADVVAVAKWLQERADRAESPEVQRPSAPGDPGPLLPRWAQGVHLGAGDELTTDRSIASAADSKRQLEDMVKEAEAVLSRGKAEKCSFEPAAVVEENSSEQLRRQQTSSAAAKDAAATLATIASAARAAPKALPSRQQAKALQQVFPSMSSEKPKAVDEVVCISHLPTSWDEGSLRDRFAWYGHLERVRVERRVRLESPHSSSTDRCCGDAVWILGMLEFSDRATAREVLERERDAFEGEMRLQAGLQQRSLGWCDGLVVRYVSEQGAGLMRTEQGDVHFVVPPEVRDAGISLDGLRVVANVESGPDGALQSHEVHLPAGLLASAAATAKGKREVDISQKQKKSRSKSRGRRRGKSKDRDRRRGPRSDSSGSRSAGVQERRSPRSRSRKRGRDSLFSSAPAGLANTTGRRLELHGAGQAAESSPAVSNSCGPSVPAEALLAAQRLAAQRLLEVPAAGASAPLRPGDWLCPVCAGHNFASRANCFRCHQLAPPHRFDARNVAMLPAVALVTMEQQQRNKR